VSRNNSRSTGGRAYPPWRNRDRFTRNADGTLAPLTAGSTRAVTTIVIMPGSHACCAIA
jgi:hypothetical protein